MLLSPNDLSFGFLSRVNRMYVSVMDDVITGNPENKSFLTLLETLEKWGPDGEMKSEALKGSIDEPELFREILYNILIDVVFIETPAIKIDTA